WLYVLPRWEEIDTRRMSVSLGVLASVLLLVLFLPLPHTFMCPLQVEAHGATSVYVEVPGSLAVLRARPGSEVKAGDLLAELENTDLELTIAQLAQQRARQAAQLQSLERLRFSDRQALRQISQVRESLR